MVYNRRRLIPRAVKRVLIIGNGPLPNDDAKKRPSEGLRTWQFVKSLRGKEGVSVRLATVALDDCYGDEDLLGAGRQTAIDVGEVDGGKAGGGNGAIDRVGLLRKNFDHDGREPAGGRDQAVNQAGAGSGFIHHQISENDPELSRVLQAVIDEFCPDIIVGVNVHCAYLVSRLRFDGAFWADMNGWTMAKAQIEAYKSGSDRELSGYLKLEEAVLRRADKISVVSDAHKYAVVGELAMMKRMGVREFEKEIVDVIENGLEDFETDKIQKIVKTVKKLPSVDQAWSAGTYEEVEEDGLRYFRGADSFSGADLPQNAFVILWLGGYSAWVDEETLFKGVEAAMEEIEGDVGGRDEREGAASSGLSDARSGAGVRDARRKICFVSTGGLSDELKHEPANKTFLKFKEMVGLSRFKDRFVFLGWVPAKHIPYLYREADVGMNVDRRCLETNTGSRNRILEMMKFNLPVITTLGTELSYQVQSTGGCRGVQSGSPEELRDAVLELYKNPARRKDYGDKGRRYIDQYCPYDRVMKPFERWIEGVTGPTGTAGAGGSSGAAGRDGRGRSHKALDEAAGRVAGRAAKAARVGAEKAAKGLLKSASKFLKRG